jgi:hypothetical protein
MRVVKIPTKTIDSFSCFMGFFNLGLLFKIRENHREYKLKDEIY